METLTCKEVNQIDMVEYLASLGYRPEKIRNEDHWYLSPFHQERTASFKVNRRKNIWYDHSIGKGGTLVDFGILYHKCTIPELLQRLSPDRWSFSFHQPHSMREASITAGEEKGSGQDRILILDKRPIAHLAMREYLAKRCIPLEIAKHYCQEVDFILHGKQHTVVGFRNRAGGYELRSENFKGGSSPKAEAVVGDGGNELVVFEGFFDFLSYHFIPNKQQTTSSDFLILNSLSFLERSRSFMEKYQRVGLMLDHDSAGKEATRKVLQWDNERYSDQSQFYQGKKDLNDWLVTQNVSAKRRHRIRRTL